MNQSELVQKLNDFFEVQAYDESGFWSGILAANMPVYHRFAEADFVQGSWNGLMLCSTEEIDRVYLIVFPDQAVLDTILALELERGAPGAMIFAHHPADFEESGRGFLAISEAQLEALREHNISYYSCHAPLDCHQELSTVIALADAIKLHDWEPFAPHHGGLEGVHGRVHNISFGKFAEHLAEVSELPYIRYNQIRFNGQPVERVAVIPGGGDDPGHLEQVRDLGCDTFVTGYWWLVGDYEYAAQQREAMRALVPRLPMNLIGTSHYASEMVVMRDQLPGWFRNAGIEAKFIKQPDPWR
ncbi:MAG: Nif3-like dinuclear metal center hexameric protein [Anaerolineae bacterium]|jgi:putative NIF3 family GTP cyclohydrolase 1 type 2|nr:Nif3-like dinuclear metal center hexameric protein [Anaerolineae bacterium]